MNETCVFCEIAQGSRTAAIVWEDELTLAFIDLRQFHPGHTLVIPRAHLRDVRAIDHEIGAALMASVARITRAVGSVFPNQGLSLWHSIGDAAFQEVPHLHFHVHPRILDDGLLKIYPHFANTPAQDILEGYAALLRSQLE